MWFIGIIIFIWIFGALIYWIRELIMYLGFCQNNDGTEFFYIIAALLAFIWFIGFCVKHKDD